MAISVKLNKVRRVPSTGRIYLQWEGGLEMEFQSFQEAKDWAKDIDSGEALEIMRKLLARWYLLRDPSGATPSTVEGKTITLDLAQAVALLTVA